MVLDEPVLDLADIQGHSIAGFRKDHQRLVFGQLDQTKVQYAKAWLKTYAASISSAEAVDAFNLAFRTLRAALQREPTDLQALWRNIAFTATGLAKLTSSEEVLRFADPAFKIGAVQRAGLIGDPASGPGSPSTWIVGAPGAIPDFCIILGADDLEALNREVSGLTESLSAFCLSIHVEFGETRTAARGHEHFGYKDGISQPGVRGRTRDGKFFTPRLIDASDPLALTFAAPGQPLLWPGEFLLNLPRQKPNSDPTAWIKTTDGPDWATNGSYMIFRRLRQDVSRFNALVSETTAALQQFNVFKNITEDAVGAMLVGRFKSGAPIMRVNVETPAFEADPYASNNFFFAQDTKPYKAAPGEPIPSDAYTLAVADPIGSRCPFAAHIRKANPRDQGTDFGAATNNLEHRILRRGIPYGPDYDPAVAGSAELDRGLLFVGFVSSIVEQFERVVSVWLNNSNQPDADAGLDPLLGQNSTRQMSFRDEEGVVVARVPTGVCPVMATGAAYLFAPSRSAIRDVLTV